MGLFADVSIWWRTMEEAGRPASNQRRDLTDEDRLAWDEAQDQRMMMPSPRMPSNRRMVTLRPP